MNPEPEKKRERGKGSVFQNGSDTWWIKYYERGIPRRESSKSTDKKDAEALLKRRLAEVETGVFNPKASIQIDELVSDVLADYKEKARKSYDTVEQRWRVNLKPFFGKRKAGDITTDMVRRYSKQRIDDGAEPATINRELAILKRAFNLGLQSTPPKIRMVPYIPTFKENNVRTGFLSDEDYATLAEACSRKGLWLRAALAVGQNYGWRRKEVISMRVSQVDFGERTIRLEVGTTKNNAGRIVTMTQEVYELLQACAAGKKPEDALFTRENGKTVKDLRSAWQSVCAECDLGKFTCPLCNEPMPKRKCKCGNRGRRKYEGLLFHDLRRTGVRNLRRRGKAETVIMKITGHKTASVFKRYDIVDMADIADAIASLDAKHAEISGHATRRMKERHNPDFGQSSGRDAENSTDDGAITKKQILQ